MTDEKDPRVQRVNPRERLIGAFREMIGSIEDACETREDVEQLLNLTCAYFGFRTEPTAEDVVALLVRGVEYSGGPSLDGGLMSKMLGMMKGGPTGVVKQEEMASAPSPKNPCPRCGKSVTLDVCASPPTVYCPHCGWTSPAIIEPA